MSSWITSTASWLSTTSDALASIPSCGLTSHRERSCSSGVEVDGTRTWLLLDGEEPKTVVVDLVDTDPVRLQRLDDLVTKTEAANPGRTKPLIIGVEGIHGIPDDREPASAAGRGDAPPR